MRWLLLLLIACCQPAAWASITPVTLGSAAAVQATSGEIATETPLDSVTAENVARATAAEAAVAAGKPADFLVSFKVSALYGDPVQSTSSGIDLPTVKAVSAAHQQAYAAAKSSVLGVLRPAVQPTAAAVTPEPVTTEAGAATRTAAPAAPGPAVELITDYLNLPIMHLQISSAAELARLRGDPMVASVVPNGVARKMTMNGLSMIGQPAVVERGYLGAGTVVTIDTGLDYTREAFGPCTAPGVPAATCKVAYVQDIAPEDNSLDDEGEAHGTNVAGIIAGVAPGVKLINLDVFLPNGDAEWSDLIKGVDWSVANRDKYNITVINLSLGGGKISGNCDSQPLAVAINSATAQGIICAAASGNEAHSDALIIPACASKAVSVGAVYPETVGPAGQYSVCSDDLPQPDNIACFSNSAPMLTMLAPGVAITAAGETMSGTSQATPFVSAALAVMRGRYPGYSVQQTIEALTSTGKLILDPRNGLEKPRLNLRAAASISCTPNISPSSVLAPIEGGTFTLTVTPPTSDCTWTVAAPVATWMRIVGANTGVGPGTVTLQVDPAEVEARGVGVAVAAEDGSSGLSVLISQAIAPAGTGDRRAPLMSGRVQVQGLQGAVMLTWPAARDNGSGVSSYMVVYNAGSRPPRPRCITGTQGKLKPQVSGNSMTLTVPGLLANTRYSFRVCPIDAAGNVGVGSMWRGTPVRRR